MKNNLYVAMFLLIIAPFQLSAQFKTNSASVDTGDSDTKNHFFSVSASYLSTGFNMWSVTRAYGLFLNGVGVTANHQDRIWQKVPLYVDYGLNIQYSGASTTIDGVRATMDLVCLGLPVNLGYRVQTSLNHFSVHPYTGLNPYVILSWKTKNQNTGEEVDYFEMFKSQAEKSEGKSSRVCLDWNIGCRLIWRQFFMSFSYRVPLTRFANYAGEEIYTNFSQAAISIGYNF